MYFLIDIENDEVLGSGKTREAAIESFLKNYDVAEYSETKLSLAAQVKPMKVAIGVLEAK